MISAHLRYDPLTGLPVIRLNLAVDRVLGRGVDGKRWGELAEKLRAVVPIVEIVGFEFLLWSGFVDFLQGGTTEIAEEEGAA